MPAQPLRRWLGLIAIALGVALIVVDITIVSVIIPSIIEDLRISSAQAQWIQESYAIVLAALLCWSAGSPTSSAPAGSSLRASSSSGCRA